MIHYYVESIAEAWKTVCKHHLEFSSNVMDLQLSKAGPCALSILHPENRIPSKECVPFIPFWLSILSMTAEDSSPELIKKHIPQISGFQDMSGRFSLAMGARLRRNFGIDQYDMLLRNLREGMQLLPVMLFDAEHDNRLTNRLSSLSVVFSILNDRIEVLVTMDSVLVHEVPFHSELCVISLWQEMLCQEMGKRIGPMEVVCGATVAMQDEHPKLRKVVQGPYLPQVKNSPLLQDDVEQLQTEFKAWPLVGASGKGYRSCFFRKTVIPMAAVCQEINRKESTFEQKKSAALIAAERVADEGWKSHVTHWIQNYFEDVSE